MTNDVDSQGEYNYNSTNLHPYFGWFPNEGLKLWAIAGYGSGEIEIIVEEEAKAGHQRMLMRMRVPPTLRNYRWPVASASSW